MPGQGPSGPAAAAAPGKVSAAHAAAVAAGRLRADAAQAAVLPALDAALAAAEAAGPPGLPAPEPGAGWRGWLGGRPEPAPPAGPLGLYLWGGVGRGKSMLMDMTARASGVPVRRVHFHGFMLDIHAGLADQRRAGAQDAVRPVAMAVAEKVRLLCFDEMQITDIADAMIVGRLFEVLFAQGVHVITTSNRVPEDLYKHGLNRAIFLPFIAMIRARMRVQQLASDTDHRQGRAAGAPAWFTPAGDAARAALDAAWADLTGGAAPAPLAIPVQGRVLTLPAQAGGVGRAGFWDLCGRALGPADYLALAKALDVLIVDGIPRLTIGNYNEARRFVTLIDTLYEARVRLIASAADAPEALYAEGEGSFEFERTASRLREMQDPAWGRAGG